MRKVHIDRTAVYVPIRDQNGFLPRESLHEVGNRQRQICVFLINLRMLLRDQKHKTISKHLDVLIPYLQQCFGLPEKVVRYSVLNTLYGFEVALPKMAEFRRQLLSPKVVCGHCGVLVSHTFTSLGVY